jgi:hypothetical protein
VRIQEGGVGEDGIVAARICGNLSGAEKGGVPVWAGFAVMAHGLTIIVLRLSLCIQKSSLLVYAAFPKDVPNTVQTWRDFPE